MELIFKPGEFPDLDAFRRGYAALYAESLRDGIPIRVAGDLTAEQQKTAQRIAKDAQRGERSLRRDVNATSRGCSLKRHFTGCLRQIVGMAEKQAARDPNRFTWNRQWKQATKGRKGTNGGYGRTQKLRCQQMLESYGIFTPARRFRNGAWRIGWDVAAHDKLTEVVDERCHLNISRSVISPRERGEQLDDYLARTIHQMAAEGISEGISNDAEGIPEGISEGISNFSEGISNPPKPLMEKDMEEGQNRTSGAIPVIPVIPVKQIPVIPAEDPFSFPCLPQEDRTQNQKNQFIPLPDNPYWSQIRLQGQPHDQKLSSDLTDPIDAVLNWQPDPKEPPNNQPTTLAELVDGISDGLFDVNQLKRFCHQKELLACCLAAQGEFEGSSTNDPAAVMGRAMELLKTIHGRNAPRGWVPVMKKMRARSEATQ